MKHTITLLAFAAATGTALAGTIPPPTALEMIPGNSFTQQWQQQLTGTFNRMVIEFERHTETNGIQYSGFEAVNVFNNGWDEVASFDSAGNTQFLAQGPAGTPPTTFRFNLTYFGDIEDVDELSFNLWYYNGATAIGGLNWRNFNDTGDSIAEGFQGKFFVLDADGAVVIPLPGAVGLGLAGLGLVGLRRRRSA